MNKNNKIIIITCCGVLAIAIILCAVLIPLSLKDDEGNGVNKYGFEVANADKIDYIYSNGEDPQYSDDTGSTTENVLIEPIAVNIQNLMNLVDNKSQAGMSGLRSGYVEGYTLKMQYNNSEFSLTIYPPEISGGHYNCTFEYRKDVTVSRGSDDYVLEWYTYEDKNTEDISAIMSYLESLNA